MLVLSSKPTVALVFLMGLMTLLLFGFANQPVLEVKIFILSSIALSGLSVFILAQWLFRSTLVALLCSIVYLLSPYFLMNVTMVGNHSAAISQALLPLVLYYTLKSLKKPSVFIGMLTISSWVGLLVTNWMTFLISALFISLFLSGLVLFDRTLLRGAIRLVYLCLLSCLLGLMAMFFSPSVHELAPLSQNNLLTINYIGWPVVFAALVLGHSLLQKRLVFVKASKKTILILLILFSMAFFAAEAFIHFSYLMSSIVIGRQFIHALLLQMIWIGTLLFGWMLLETTRGKLSFNYVLFGALLIGLFS